MISLSKFSVVVATSVSVTLSLFSSIARAQSTIPMNQQEFFNACVSQFEQQQIPPEISKNYCGCIANELSAIPPEKLAQLTPSSPELNSMMTKCIQKITAPVQPPQ